MHLFRASNEILICVSRVCIVTNLYIMSINKMDVLNLLQNVSSLYSLMPMCTASDVDLYWKGISPIQYQLN